MLILPDSEKCFQICHIIYLFQWNFEKDIILFPLEMTVKYIVNGKKNNPVLVINLFSHYTAFTMEDRHNFMNYYYATGSPFL